LMAGERLQTGHRRDHLARDVARILRAA